MSDPKKTLVLTYDPLVELMDHYAGRKGEKKEKPVKAGTIEERLKNRIVDGDKVGLNADLDEALTRYSALDIINAILLGGMKVVGELFGNGQMQLPFVLQSAEVMKAAVTYLETFMDKSAVTSKGTMVIATVKGDVHDIGKNLVDIILTNNGYTVVNLGIKCAIETMLHAAQERHADVIGMSGLLVKSTLIMKENLEVMNERNITMPVILGGAALTRRFVEQDLRRVYRGPVMYANDAFDGLRYMQKIVEGEPLYASVDEIPNDEDDRLTGSEAKIALARREEAKRVLPPRNTVPPQTGAPARSAIGASTSVPSPPFWGPRVVEDISMDDVFKFVNDVALIRGQWQVRKGKLGQEEYKKLLADKVYPEYERLKRRVKEEGLLRPAVVYGYYPCQSAGDDLIVYGTERGEELVRFTFPRQKADRRLCLSDFFAPVASGRMDLVAFQLVTMGRVAAEYSARLFASNNYKEYLYFHGLSVECAEALAELWHKRIREELGIAGNDAKEIKRLFSQGYQGSRYSFGYPACPNLEDQAKLFQLLDGARIGVRLTDEYSLDPEQSTNAIVVHHPEAKYFNVA